LEKRLRAIEDEREIRDLVIRYAQLLDARDHRGYAALFAREGRWTGQMGDVVGPAAIEAMLLEAFGPTPAGFRNTADFHIMSNILVEVDGDRARAESRLVYFVRGEGSPPAPMPCRAGRYHDELVREEGKWRFAHRRVIAEIPTLEDAARARAEQEEGERP